MTKTFYTHSSKRFLSTVLSHDGIGDISFGGIDVSAGTKDRMTSRARPMNYATAQEKCIAICLTW